MLLCSEVERNTLRAPIVLCTSMQTFLMRETIPESCNVNAMFSFTKCVSLDVLQFKSLITIPLLLSFKKTDVFFMQYYWCKNRRNALTFGLLPWLMCKVLISRENTVKLPYGRREVAACQLQLQSRTFATANVCQDSLCQVLYVNVG